MSQFRKPHRPCDRCRKRKTKCVFDQYSDTCTFCTINSATCEFLLPPVKKRRKPEHQEVSPETQSNGAEIPDLAPDLNAEHPQIYPTTHMVLSAGNNDANGPFEGPKRTSHLPPKKSFFFNVEGNNEYDKLIFSSITDKIYLAPIQSVQTTVLKQNQELFIEIQCPPSPEITPEMAKIEALIGSVGPSLVSLYFRIVHPSFPILSKAKYLQTPPNSVLLVSCLYLFALNWWSFDSELLSEIIPSQDELEVLAESNLYRELKRPTISTIQAGLLLIQHQSFKSHRELPFACWPMQAAIIAAAETLGLNKDPSLWKIPNWEKALRKRLSWALYSQEKWLSLTVDKPSHISRWFVLDLDEEVDFQDFYHDAAPDSVLAKIDIISGRKLFMEQVKLSKLIPEITEAGADTLASYRTYNDTLAALRLLISKVSPIQSLISDLQSQLPQDLVLEHNVSRGFISGAPNVYILNFMLLISLLKPVLRLLAICREDFLGRAEISSIRDDIFIQCNTILDQVLKFMNELRAEHLQGFWYTSARNGFSNIVVFGFLVMKACRTAVEHGQIADKMEEYVWKLKVNSKNAEFLQHAVNWWTLLRRFMDEQPGNDFLENFGHLQDDILGFIS